MAASVAWAQSDQFRIHIPSEPLADALVALAIQARLSIGHSGIDFHGTVGNAVDGWLRPEEAASRLLAGTGYRFVFLDPETIQIELAAAPSTPPTVPEAIEEVVVTATKRPAVARLVPYSLKAVSSSELRDLGSDVVTSLTQDIAGLGTSNLGPGQDILFIRGISDSAFAGRTQSTVGLYLDEARLTDDAPDPGLKLVDVERIELLRGPQGTLYGAGALGGVLRIITNKPVLDEVQGSAEVSTAATVGGSPSAGANGVINLPIVDGVLGLRAVAYLDHAGGFIDESRLQVPNANQTDTRGSRLSLGWHPEAEWTATLGLTDQTIMAADSQYYLAGAAPFTRTGSVLEPHKDRFLQASLTVEGSLQWASFTSASAVTNRHIGDQFDATTAWPSLTGLPAGRSTLNDARNIQTITEEARLASVAEGRWTWLGGAFLSHREEDYSAALAGPGPTGEPLVARDEQRQDDADEAALFGEVTYSFGRWLDATAGARLFYSSLGASDQIANPLVRSVEVAGGSNEKTGITRKIVLATHPAETVTAYVSASEGFRLGGVNIENAADPSSPDLSPDRTETEAKLESSVFSPDRLRTYEIGGEASFFDGRLTTAGAAWLTSWKNIQSDQILPNGAFYIANVGNAHDPGAELEISLIALDHLRLTANAAWNSPRFVHSNPAFVGSEGRLPLVPEVAASLSVRYDLTLIDGYSAFARLTGAYKGKSVVGFDEANSPSMGNYVNTDLRLGLSHGAWQATLYADNLANARANTFAYGNPFLYGRIGQITPLRPLTIGLDVRRSF